MSISSDYNAGRFSAQGKLQEETMTEKEIIISFSMSDIRENAQRTDFPFCESDSIAFFDSKWLIRVFPNGTNAGNVDKVKVVLIGISDRIPMEVEYTLNASSNQAVIKTNKCKLTPSSPLEAIDCGGGLTKYIMTGDSMFRSSKNSNILELHLTLKTTSSNSSLVDCSAKSPNGGFYFRDHLFHKATSDVDIVVEGTRIPAHKLILSLASPVFTAMFENQMQESASNEIVISDFSEEVVRSMLCCIYDSSVVEKEMENHADQLLFIANKYELTEIESAATKHIISTVTVDNAITVLLAADKYDRAKIKSAAMDFVVSNADHFFGMSDFAGKVGNVLTNEILGYMGCMIANKRVKY